MSVQAPIIQLPSSSDFFTANLGELISGTATSEVTKVGYLYALQDSSDFTPPTYTTQLSTVAMSFTQTLSGSETLLPWSFDSAYFEEDLEPGKKLFLKFFAVDESTSTTSLSSDVSVTFVEEDQILISAPIVTALGVLRKNTELTIINEGPNMAGFQGDLLGLNYYVSTEPGGGVSGYVRMNEELVTVPYQMLTKRLQTGSTVLRSGGVEVSTTEYEVEEVPEYRYSMDNSVFERLLNNGSLPNVSYSEKSVFYFVVTSVVFDPTLAQNVESDLSAEVEGRFVTFLPTYRDLPPRSMQDILLTMSRSLLAKNPNISLVAGGVVRDMLDPVANEFTNQYVIQDFVFRSTSWDGLIGFDDADGDGVSDPVEQSPSKLRLAQALKITNNSQLQSIIDESFDKLASNFNTVRQAGLPASGQVVFYASDIPATGLTIQDGAILSSVPDEDNAASTRFRVQGSKTIPFSNRETFYNNSTGRYEIIADIIGYASGSDTNVNAGTITVKVSGIDSQLRVTNTSPTTGGRDAESNLQLANRAKLGFVSLDTGTEGGYMREALSVNGVEQARVEKSGDPLMRRDILSTGEVVGGKVDIYVKGYRGLQKSDTFAFQFGSPSTLGTNGGERFYVESAPLYRFRTTNPKVGASTPIFEVTKVRNVTRSRDYDLAGVVVGAGDGDTIQLAQNSTNISIGLATLDVVEVDYRYRGSDTYIMQTQPVEGIVSVVGDIDGELPPENYRMVKLQDPLLTGRSTEADDGIKIIFFDGRPTEELQQVTAEAHQMLTLSPIELRKKGVDPDTIVVSADPEQAQAYDKDVDYTVVPGNDRTPTQLISQPNSAIRNGALVYVSYSCGQNFTVVYTVNGVLQDVKDQLSQDRAISAGADVAVKAAVRNQVQISLSLIRKNNTDEVDVINKVQTVLGNFINQSQMGQTLYLDDVVARVKNIEEVDHLILPLSVMQKADGSFIPNDVLGSLDFRVYNENANSGITSYISADPVLNYGTVDNGGPSNLFRTVYENGVQLVLADTPLEVSLSRGRAYIQADGRIIVSTRDSEPPQLKAYSAAYYTFEAPGEEKSGDIFVDEIEHLWAGANSIRVDAAAVQVPVKRGL